MAEVNPNSKQQRAIQVVLAGKKLGKSRKLIILDIREQCNMSDAGAATYYQNAVTKLREKGLIKKETVQTVDVVVEKTNAMDMSLLANCNVTVETTETTEEVAE